MNREDAIRLVIVLVLAGVAFTLAYIIVGVFHAVFAVIAWAVLSVGIFRAIMYFFGLRIGRMSMACILAAVVATVCSAVIVWVAYDVVKVVALILLGWYIFKLMLRYLEPEIERELMEVFG